MPMPSCGVRPSVCHVRTFCQILFTIGWPNRSSFPHQTSWQYSDGNPPNGVSNAGGVGIDRDSKRIAGYRSMTSAVRDPQLTVVRVVVHRSYGACLFTAQRPPRITRCDQCCKGDASSQWEKANLPLSPHPHPLTDSHQILHT